ncbi:MAG: phosphotransferase [Actinophytocola sp.]|nr:phosphotransferase [Actinophytocola sp.]
MPLPKFDNLNGDVVRLLEERTLLPGLGREPSTPLGGDFVIATRHHSPPPVSLWGVPHVKSTSSQSSCGCRAARPRALRPNRRGRRRTARSAGAHHGEPHRGNTITTPNGVVLIDWDTTLIAAPERDLWALVGEDPRLSMTTRQEPASSRARTRSSCTGCAGTSPRSRSTSATSGARTENRRTPELPGRDSRTPSTRPDGQQSAEPPVGPVDGQQLGCRSGRRTPGLGRS